ncbi:MAG TPA: hypothetical protein VKZ18_10350 [Polyangia bacterium]|nr:hypothetical protein [Polyangia bacterium]
MAASGHPDADPDVEDLSDQIDVDPSQDVTVEASEEATLEVAESEDEHANTLTPPPVGMQELPQPSRRAPTLMGLALPSLPLPGVTAAAPPHVADETDDDDEVTVMARPSVTDDEEEPTKIEPAETALHAAASKDDDEVTTALSAQASVERERALRKSHPPSLDMPLASHGYGSDDSAEFEDPEDDDGIKIGGETPGIAVDDDAISTSSYTADSADTEEPSSELEAVLAPRRPTATLGSLSSLGSSSPFSGSPIGSPVLGRPDSFGSPRLPTPSPGFGGLSLPSPAAPAPTASPFSARLAPAGSPYGARSASPAALPALQIPAPSGVAATTAGTTGGFLLRKAPLPIVGVVAYVAAAFIFGVVVGAKFLGARGAGNTTVAAQSAPAAAPVVIQPVAPAPPAPPAATTAAATPPPAPAAAAAPTPPAPAAAAAPTPPAAAAAVAEETPPAAAKPAPKPAVKRVARPAAHKVVASADDLPIAKPAKAAPAPKAAKPAKSGGKAKAWVDPFAE